MDEVVKEDAAEQEDEGDVGEPCDNNRYGDMPDDNYDDSSDDAHDNSDHVGDESEVMADDAD